MFGHDSQPSRIYNYGAKRPMTNADVVDTQMRLAHHYRNDLVTLEINRRSRVDVALCEIAPTLKDVEAKLADAEARLEAARSEVKKANSSKRKRGASAEDKKAISEIRSVRKGLYVQRKELRKATFSSKKWKKHEAEIDAWADAERKRTRAAVVEAGLYWGTYLCVEQSLGSVRKGAPPRHQSWDGGEEPLQCLPRNE